MLNKIITSSMLIAASAVIANAAADANAFFLKFGQRNDADALKTEAVNGNSWNYVNTQNEQNNDVTWGGTTDPLKMANGDDSSITVTAYNFLGGLGAMTTTGFSGDTSKIVEAFAQTDMTWLNSHGGVYQQEKNTMDGGVRYLSIGGLTSGKNYELTVLLGRGNAWTSTPASSTYSLTQGATNSVVSIVASNSATGANPLASNVVGGTLTAETDRGSSAANTATNWVLATFSFTFNGEELRFADATGHMSLSTLKLVAVPEPSMFGLLAGLGALALVGARRRRK